MVAIRGTLLKLLTSSPRRAPRGLAWLAPALAGGILVAACSSDQGITLPSSPTLQAAATQVGGVASTVVAAAPTIATSAAQVGGTAVAGAAPVATSAANAGATAVSAAGPAATSAANAAATAAAAASPVVTRVATAVSEARATADARTPMNGAEGRSDAGTPGAGGTPSPAASPASRAPAPTSAAITAGPVSGSATGSVGGGVVSSSAASGAAVRIAGTGLMAGHPIVTLQNTTDTAIRLAGWQLHVDGEGIVLPPNCQIGPGDSIMLHLADGGSRGSDLYLGRESADLVRGLQPGERMTLLDAHGQKVTEAIVPSL